MCIIALASKADVLAMGAIHCAPTRFHPVSPEASCASGAPFRMKVIYSGTFRGKDAELRPRGTPCGCGSHSLYSVI